MDRKIEIRPVRAEDASELADLINEIIALGGTTAWEEPFSQEALATAMLTGPHVVCCFVAAQGVSGVLMGFQSLETHDGLPSDVGDIATFARVGATQGGVGSSLFAATRAEAARQGLTAINATIRADNTGGLKFYSRMGFVDHDVTRDKPLKDGRPVDRIHKRYALG